MEQMSISADKDYSRFKFLITFYTYLVKKKERGKNKSCVKEYLFFVQRNVQCSVVKILTSIFFIYFCSKKYQIIKKK